MLKLNDYRAVVGDKIIDDLLTEAKPLLGKDIVHVNSTFYGGGVAEILDSLVCLMNDLGIKAGWRMIKGSDDFFKITKLFHNSCQGAEYELSPEVKKTYEEVNEKNSNFMHLEKADAIIMHDPQVLPLINYYQKNQPWIWRCHIDITSPNPQVWNYLLDFINKYDEVIISDEKFRKKEIVPPQTIIMPSINPLNQKNRPMNDEEIRQVLEPLRINLNKPIVSQISRFDYWKDPLGVIEAFEKARKKVDCQLVLLGNFADDDPEGTEIYQKTLARANNNPDIKVLVNVDNNDLVVNALQRISRAVIQKSLREGFALTVSEALWKETPVIGTRAGGIPNQIIDGKNGYLVDGIEECAQRIITLVEDEKLAKEMGKFGKEFVKNNFLITRHLSDYLKILKRVIK